MKKLCWLYGFATLVFMADGKAAPAFYNSGVDANGNQLPGGGLDSHYQMRQLAAGSVAGSTNWTPAVAMDTSITWSSWIKPADARWIYVADSANLGQDWGTYGFKTTFDLTGYDPSTAALSGEWALDQYGSIYLNGVLITNLPDGNWNSQLNAFTINSGFVSGVNTLTFDVRFPDGGDGMIVSGATLTAVNYPILTIVGGKTIVWPTNSTGYVLQSSPAVTGPYSNATNAVSIIGTNFSISFLGSQSAEFFRLKK